MNDAILVMLAVLLAVFSILMGNVVTEAETRKQCDAFGKTFLNGKVYTCTKQ
jgi:hypothetical protein